jgi:PAS domain S-box-containing protein
VKDAIMKRVVGLFLFVIAVFAVVAVVSLRNINRSVTGSDWVNHTHSVILETEDLRLSLLMGETSGHTFALTGDAREQRACVDALSDVDEHLAILTALTRNEPAQKEEVAGISNGASKRSQFLRNVLAARQSGDANRIQTLLADDAGRPEMKEFQDAVETLKYDELGLLTQRDTASFLQAQTTRWTVWAGITLDLLILAGAGWLIRDDISARRRAATILMEANELLEARVRERTAELSTANQRLVTENLERRWTNVGLEHQLRYNNLIIHSISDLVLVITKATNITRVNPALVRLTGREAQELINLPFSTFARLSLHAGSTPPYDPIARAMGDGRDLREQRAVVIDKVGREIPVHLSLFPLRDHGKVVGGVVILRTLSTTRSQEP